MSQVMDLASPPLAATSILALNLASGSSDPLCMCSLQNLLCTRCVPEPSLAVWILGGGAEARTELGGFRVDDAFSPPPRSPTVRTTREVLEKLGDGDSVPVVGLSRLEAAVQPRASGKEDAQLRHLSDQHHRTCETLQATQDALLSAREDLEHKKKLHSSTIECLQSRIDDLRVQMTKLVQTLDPQAYY